MATGIRVGIVEPDPGIRFGRRMILDTSGDISVVLEEDSASRLLEIFDDYLLDVLLVDQRLRGSTGIELTAELTKIKLATSNKARILLTSVFFQPEILLEALLAGASSAVGQDQGPAVLVQKSKI